jgi:hypothetical protein
MVLGYPKKQHLFTLEELQPFFPMLDQLSEIKVYERAEVNGAVYHSMLYDRAKHHQSKFVEICMPNLDSNSAYRLTDDPRSFIGRIEAFFCMNNMVMHMYIFFLILVHMLSVNIV